MLLSKVPIPLGLFCLFRCKAWCLLCDQNFGFYVLFPILYHADNSVSLAFFGQWVLAFLGSDSTENQCGIWDDYFVSLSQMLETPGMIILLLIDLS
jgi:hypothetical protein